MLLELLPTLDPAVVATDNQLLESLEHLLVDCRAGSHRLLVTKSFAEFFKSNNALSKSTAAFLRTAANARPQELALQSALPVYCELGHSTVPALEIRANQAVITLPLGHFVNPDRSSATSLVCENQTDCSALRVMAEVAARSLGVVPRMLSVGGGGGTTFAAAAALRDQKQFTLSVVDSDFAFPGDSLGETARRLLQEVRADAPWFSVRHLDARELENLIPISVQGDIYDTDATRATAISQLVRMDGSLTARTALSFLDLKNGLKLGDVLSADTAGGLRAFWLAVVSSDPSVFPSVDQNCVERESCTSSIICNCVVAHGVSNHLLANFVAHLASSNPRDVRARCCPRTHAHWNNVLSTVVAWTCGANPHRA